MKMKKHLFVLAALASTLTCLARADDIQLQMVGNIYANTCLVDSASKDLTVDLGQAASSEFHDVGDTGAWKTFSLKVTHCPKSLALATAFFTVRRMLPTQPSLPTRAARRGWRWSWRTARTISSSHRRPALTR